LTGGAQVSVTVRMDRRVKAAIATIPEQAWTTIEYTDAVFDKDSGRWISSAEVAELDFLAFGAQPQREQVPGRLVVRRIRTSTPTPAAPSDRTQLRPPITVTSRIPGMEWRRPPDRDGSPAWPRPQPCREAPCTSRIRAHPDVARPGTHTGGGRLGTRPRQPRSYPRPPSLLPIAKHTNAAQRTRRGAQIK
jgi:hypothetical protein